jgi:hypothetical protein
MTCGRIDVIPVMVTRSAIVDMAVKWRLNPKKRFGWFLWNFLWQPRRKVITDIVEWITNTQNALSGWVAILL